MATYDILSVDELTEFLAAFFQYMLPEADVSQFSDNYKRIRSLAGGLADNHSLGVASYREVFADVASRDGLERQAYPLLGLPELLPTPSSRADAGRLTGTVAAAYTIGQTLTHESGLRFQLNESGTIPAAGFVDVDILAIDTGEATNLEAGQVLTFESPPAGIDASVELQLDLENGEDRESTAALRARVLTRWAERGKGGEESQWVDWVVNQTSVPGIVEAYAYRHRDGHGTVDVVGFKRGSGSARYLNSTERSLIFSVLENLRPHTCTQRVLETEGDPQAVKLTVTAKSGEQFARDWNDSVPLVVSGYVGATRTLTFTTDRPTDMRAGDRICWDATSGQLVQIQSLSGTNAVVLAIDPSPAPSGNIYSGGPLTELVQTAIRNLVSGYDRTLDTGEVVYQPGIGPAKGVWAGSWDDSLRPNKIAATATAIDGVDDVTVTAPAAVYTPTDYGYPDDTKTKVVEISYVFVRYA